MTEIKHIPVLCRKRKYILPYCVDKPSVYISYDQEEELLENVEYITVQEGVFVSPLACEDGFNESYFATPIEGKNVYVPLYGRGDFLPTNVKYFIASAGENIDFPKGDFYKQVVINNEKTLADLYKKAWHYRYDPEPDAFICLTEGEALKNLTRPLLESDIELLFGSPMDRVADYGRIILFLLSKALLSMTEEEKAVFEEITPFIPTLEKLRHVVKREARVQSLVTRHKNDPIGRLAADGE